MAKPNKAAQRASVRALDAIFRPRSIAVVGASRRRYQIGHEIVRNLVEGGFCGPVYPVNPSASVVYSMHCFARVNDIPGPVDLAVLVVPAPLVLPAARDCARKGVRGLVVITAGFSEVGGDGAQRQEELLALCKKHGMRLVGPNCMGVLNTDPAVSMNASFAAATPTLGGAAFLSQSGALGEAILADARSLDLGVSMFASVGNRADVSPPDLLEYWEDDPRTEQILMYLEAFGDPERFMQAARRVSAKKPILVVKSGRTARGAKAAISHTGSLAGSEAAVDSLLNQCGVLRVDSMNELFTLAAAVQAGKWPQGKRVAIVTNAGGPAILATDACIALDLELADLAPATQRKLAKVVPPEASVANPVDLIASADAARFDAALGHVLADRSIDMVIAIFVSPVMIDSAAVARVFAKHASNSTKPLAACLLGKSEGEAAFEILRDAGVPNYRFPEEAAQALAGLLRIHQLRIREIEAAPRYRVQKAKARRAIETALADGRETLKGTELADLFHAYGIPIVPSRIVRDREEALQAAQKIGFPMVAKVVARDLHHKSDSGGVLLGIRDREELLDALDQLEARFRKRHPEMNVLLQSMRSDGVETFFGAATDPQFGRMLAFGLGGIHVEILKDVVFRLHPLSRTDALEMVRGVRARALFQGARGKPPVDEEELVDVLLRLSRMLSDHPEIAELDLNPFLAGYRGAGSCVLDMRVRLDAETTAAG
jgi:acetyl coenzyme A synthetase (ADP forming)-like protein